MDFGYVRVSAKDQNDARQMAALEKAGVPPRNIYRKKRAARTLTARPTSGCSAACVRGMWSIS